MNIFFRLDSLRYILILLCESRTFIFMIHKAILIYNFIFQFKLIIILIFLIKSHLLNNRSSDPPTHGESGQPEVPALSGKNRGSLGEAGWSVSSEFNWETLPQWKKWRVIKKDTLNHLCTLTCACMQVCPTYMWTHTCAHSDIHK